MTQHFEKRIDGAVKQSGKEIGSVNRRWFLKWLISSAGLSMAFGSTYSLWIEPFWLAIRNHQIPLRNLPPAFNNFRIVHLSDIHYHEKIVPVDYLERVVSIVNQLKPDLIIITGDFITSEVRKYARPAVRLLSELSAPHGVVGVLGNHDYELWSWSSVKIAHGPFEYLLEQFAVQGISILRNESLVVKRDNQTLTLVGMDELWANNFDAPKAFVGVESSQPKIIALHNPDGAHLIPKPDNSLLLAGHTHGGQVCIPFIGRPRLPVKNKEYSYGMYPFNGGRLYITSGIGFNRRVRLLVRPEIVVFQLQNHK